MRRSVWPKALLRRIEFLAVAATITDQLQRRRWSGRRILDAARALNAVDETKATGARGLPVRIVQMLTKRCG